MLYRKHNPLQALTSGYDDVDLTDEQLQLPCHTY